MDVEYDSLKDEIVDRAVEYLTLDADLQKEACYQVATKLGKILVC